MATNYPGALDDNTTLPSTPDPFVDGVTGGHLQHPPTAHGAIKALEAKVGIGSSDASAATTGQSVVKSGSTTVWSTTPRPSLCQVYSNDFPSVLKPPADGTYVYQCDAVNDEVEINAAITQAALTRGDVMLMGFLFKQRAPVLEKTAVRLRGLGMFQTRLDVDTTGWSGSGQIKLADVNVHGCEVSDMWLRGQNVAGVSGLEWDNTGGTFSMTSPDPSNRAHHLVMYDQAVSNIKLAGENRAGMFEHMRLFNAGSHGVHILGPDSHFLDLEVGSSGGHAFFLDSGASNNMLTACKGWFADQDGFRNKATRNGFVNCQAQDNGGAGFYAEFGKVSFSACHADSNGRVGGAGGLKRSGFFIPSEYVNAYGCQSYDRNTGFGTQQQWGLEVNAGMTNGRVHGMLTYGNTGGAQTGTPGAGTTIDIV